MEEIKTVEQEKTEDLYEVTPVPLDDVKSIIEDELTNYQAIYWHDYEVIIRKTISYEEMRSFVDTVVEACFDTESGNYTPENRDFMYKYCEISFFTNVELPTDYNEAYNTVYMLDLNELIPRYASAYQIADIQSSISERVQYRLDQNMDALQTELRKFESVFTALGETVASISPEDMKNMIAALSSRETIDEGKVVQALFEHRKDARDDG